jgi:hypothetical protein
LVIGILTTVYFLIVVNEAKLVKEAKLYEEDYRRNSVLTRKELKLSDYIVDKKGWLKELSFYIYALAYMFVRISILVKPVSLLFK